MFHWLHKSLWLCGSQQTAEKFFKRYQTTLPVSWETCTQVKKKVRIRHETGDWFKIGKGVHQGCILSPWVFNFYAKYITRSAGLNELQGGIKIAGRNINNLRYADDTILMPESEEELKSLFTRVKKESEKNFLKNSTLKKLRSQHPLPTPHGKQVGKKWNQWQIFFTWAPKSLWTVTAVMKLKDVCSDKPRQHIKQQVSLCQQKCV